MTNKQNLKLKLTWNHFSRYFLFMAHASLRLLPLLKIIFWEELFYVCMYYENHNFELINFHFLQYFLLKRKKKNVSSPFFWQKTKNSEKWPSISILFVIMGDDVTQGSTTTRERENANSMKVCTMSGVLHKLLSLTLEGKRP